MAIYKFLTDEDLDLGMSKYFRDIITVGAEKLHIMKSCESAALTIIKTKLNNKYDLTKLFPEIKEYDAAKDYVADQYCYKQKRIYKCTQAGTGQNPMTVDSEYWTEEDPRDHLLVKYAACITAYFMMETTNPRKMSEALEDEYAAVMDWLDLVRDGRENPDWDLLESGGSNDIPWGSNEKLDHYP